MKVSNQCLPLLKLPAFKVSSAASWTTKAALFTPLWAGGRKRFSV